MALARLARDLKVSGWSDPRTRSRSASVLSRAARGSRGGTSGYLCRRWRGCCATSACRGGRGRARARDRPRSRSSRGDRLVRPASLFVGRAQVVSGPSAFRGRPARTAARNQPGRRSSWAIASSRRPPRSVGVGEVVPRRQRRRMVRAERRLGCPSAAARRRQRPGSRASPARLRKPQCPHPQVQQTERQRRVLAGVGWTVSGARPDVLAERGHVLREQPDLGPVKARLYRGPRGRRRAAGTP